MDYKCPTCQKVIPSGSMTPDGKKQMNATHFPFCSERCRLLDLGAWLQEDYRIASQCQLPDLKPPNQ